MALLIWLGCKDAWLCRMLWSLQASFGVSCMARRCTTPSYRLSGNSFDLDGVVGAFERRMHGNSRLDEQVEV